MIDREEMLKEVNEKIATNKARIQKLLDKAELLDDDGYPTEDALEIISIWHWDDPRGWFELIQKLWHLSSWGWKEADRDHEWQDHKQYKDKIVHRYYISTGGWSGNESIIRAMQNNSMMWHLNWVQSRRGGHYIFELYEVKE